MNEVSKSPLEVSRDKIKRNLLNTMKTDCMEAHVHKEEPRYRPDGAELLTEFLKRLELHLEVLLHLLAVSLKMQLQMQGSIL